MIENEEETRFGREAEETAEEMTGRNIDAAVEEPKCDESTSEDYDEEPCGGPATDDDDSAAEDEDCELQDARRNIRAGALWCVGGLAFSFASYYFTEAGGRYFVATGAIVYGALQAFRGLYVVLSRLRREGDMQRFRTTLLAAVAAVALVGWLTAMSYRVVHVGELPKVDYEQTVECDSLRLRAIFPAGFTEVEHEYTPETDSSFAIYAFYAGGEDIGMRVEGVLRSVADDVESIEDIYDYCARRDSVYYDGGIMTPTAKVEIGGRTMLGSSGRMADSEGWIFSSYDMLHDGDLVSVNIWHREGMREDEVRRISDLFLRSVESY